MGIQQDDRRRLSSFLQTQKSSHDTPQFKQLKMAEPPSITHIHNERLEAEPEVIKVEESEEMNRFSLMHGARTVKKQ